MKLCLLFFISFLFVIRSGDTYRFFNATAVEEALKHVGVRITGIRIICEALYCHFNASDIKCIKACAENSSKFKKVTLPTENADEDIETCWNGLVNYIRILGVKQSDDDGCFKTENATFVVRKIEEEQHKNDFLEKVIIRICNADCKEERICDNECKVLCGTHWNSTNRKEYEEEYLHWANATGRF